MLDNSLKIQRIKRGKCWDTKLPSNHYDVVFTSHLIEHIPYSYTERTFSEFNRIMKIGGTIRIVTPDLELAAHAYINNDLNFFLIG